MKEMEISKVLSMCKHKKYEMTVAAFDLVDHIFKVDIPKPLKKRKLAVQAMTMLSDGQIKFGYDQNAPITVRRTMGTRKATPIQAADLQHKEEE